MHYTLRWRGASLALCVDPDDGGPALARARGSALRYRGSAPTALEAGLAELTRRFEAGDPVEQAVSGAWPGATLEKRGGPLPRWPSTLRIGDPVEGLWPFDAESVGLELGLRRLLKREQFSEGAAVADAAWLCSRGLTVSEPGPPDEDGRRVIFAAREPLALAQAEALEVQLRLDDGSSAEAGRRLGEALGYPPCCVDAYARVGARDDRALAEALLPARGAPPASPLTQWLSAPLGVVSHTPCGLGCEPTMRLAEALLEGLEARSPGFTERWRRLAERVHVVGEARALALAVTGGLITDAIRLTMPEGPSLEGLCRPDPALVGQPLGAVVQQTDVLADHRGRR